MECRNCGYKLKKKQSVCPRCGYSFDYKKYEKEKRAGLAAASVGAVGLSAGILNKIKNIGNKTDAGFTVNASEIDNTNPMKVFEEVYNVILDRKENPKEGSYTNYLFDKGIDKILKKVGEEATEIVIAAKNPDAQEMKYEISDFLYHVMVLMAERGVTWEDITEELSRR